ncbi:MAG: hypothetical protein DDT23_00431 [candidate division WS2 bacterium]|nr:hypothetical protein [Candidatus Lithacetigena glycinireducens]
MFIRLFIVFLLLPFVILLVLPATVTSIFENKQVEIVFEGSLPPNINEYISNPLSFRNYLLLSESNISNQILHNHPLIKEIEINRYFPAKLYVRGYPRIIIASVLHQKRVWLLDSEGKIINNMNLKYPGVHEVEVKSVLTFSEQQIYKVINALFSMEKEQAGFISRIKQCEFANLEELLITFINGCQVKVYYSELPVKQSLIIKLAPLHSEGYLLDFTTSKQVVVQKVEKKD